MTTARQYSRSIVGRVEAGVLSSGCPVVVVKLVGCALRSLRGPAKKHRTAAVFRVLVAGRLPARISIAGLVCAMGFVVVPASASIIRLVPGGCRVAPRKNGRRGFPLLRAAPARAGSLLLYFRLFVPFFPSLRDRPIGLRGRSAGYTNRKPTASGEHRWRY